MSAFDLGHVGNKNTEKFATASKKPGGGKPVELSQQKVNLILEYFRKNRRPLNVVALVENLNGALTKKEVEALLLHEQVAPFLVRREIGARSSAYLYREADLPVEEGVKAEFCRKNGGVDHVSPAGAVENFSLLLAKKSAEVKQRVSRLKAEIKAEKDKQAKEKEAAKLKTQYGAAVREREELTATKSTLEARAQLRQEMNYDPAPFWKLVQKWVQRKKTCFSLVDAAVGENGNRVEFMESIGCDMDKEGLKPDDYQWFVSTCGVPRD
ncbi:unnamed protein product [Amoebophrya sp. A120]|nr:unnamed protein product [Amoebophrya sp. A120]|eukprot:GSA120T00000161001.1